MVVINKIFSLYTEARKPKPLARLCHSVSEKAVVEHLTIFLKNNF